jgi:prepilin-type processing-associated H-X9-DG protein
MIVSNYINDSDGSFMHEIVSSGDSWAWRLRKAGYFPQPKILVCPSTSAYDRYKDEFVRYPDTNWTWGWISYGYNYVGLCSPAFLRGTTATPTADRIPKKISQIKNSSKVILTAEAIYAPASTLRTCWLVGIDLSSNYLIDQRHSGAANVLWVDGHASTEKDARKRYMTGIGDGRYFNPSL